VNHCAHTKEMIIVMGRRSSHNRSFHRRHRNDNVYYSANVNLTPYYPVSRSATAVNAPVYTGSANVETRPQPLLRSFSAASGAGSNVSVPVQRNRPVWQQKQRRGRPQPVNRSTTTATTTETQDPASLVLPLKFTKSLRVGIDYRGSQHELFGCINDVTVFGEKFAALGGEFGEERILTDDTPTKPNRAELLEAMKWLVADAKYGDTLFFQYSGHGAYQNSTDSGESDHQDETLIPLDVETAGMIPDNEIYNTLFANLPAGVDFFFFCDCCHSGTMCDLGYQLQLTDNSVPNYGLPWSTEVLVADYTKNAQYYYYVYRIPDFDAYIRYLQYYYGGTTTYDSSAGKVIGEMRAVREDNCSANVVSFSGCRDDQTSQEKNGQGAMTLAFLANLEKAITEPVSVITFLQNVRNDLSSEGFVQKPQLCASFPLSSTALMKWG